MYPVSSGGAIATMSYIQELQHHCELSVLMTNPYVPSEEDLTALKEKWHLSNVVCPSKQVGNPWKDKLKKYVSKAGLLKKPSFSQEDHAKFQYSPLEMEDVELITDLCAKNDFDVIEVHFVEKFNAIFALPEKALKVAVNHEPRFRRTMVQNQNHLLHGQYGKYLEKYQRTFESTIMNLYDAVLVFNDKDKLLIQESVSKPVYSTPIPVGKSELQNISSQHSKVNRIFFIGSGDHYPNFDAVSWYAEQLAKKVFDKTGFLLEVVGKWSENQQNELKSPYVKFLGFIDDLGAFEKEAIMLVPVRTGGGIRTKIQWAMAKGIPVISTSFGYEGIPCENNHSILQAENAEEFAESILKLQNDQTLYNQIRINAQKIIERDFDPQKIVNQRLSIYHNLIEN